MARRPTKKSKRRQDPFKKFSKIAFPLKTYQKKNLREFAEMARRFSNIRSKQQAEKFVQKGDGFWLQALLAVPALVDAVLRLIK